MSMAVDITAMQAYLHSLPVSCFSLPLCPKVIALQEELKLQVLNPQGEMKGSLSEGQTPHDEPSVIQSQDLGTIDNAEDFFDCGADYLQDDDDDDEVHYDVPATPAVMGRENHMIGGRLSVAQMGVIEEAVLDTQGPNVTPNTSPVLDYEYNVIHIYKLYSRVSLTRLRAEQSNSGQDRIFGNHIS